MDGSHIYDTEMTVLHCVWAEHLAVQNVYAPVYSECTALNNHWRVFVSVS